MTWELELFKRTSLGVHKNCLALLQAYSDSAPRWQRLLLATYVGIGPPIARCFGGDTRTVWQQADAIIGDLFAASQLSPREVVDCLTRYLRIKLDEKDHLAFDEACTLIYDQAFYPLVTHFTFALQPSAVARMRFVKRVVSEIPLARASVADLGCGSALMLSEVLSLKPAWTGYALDVSETAVSYAKRLAHHKKTVARTQFQTGSIAELPFTDHSLDVLIASEVVEHLQDPERAFLEFFRVLNPRGVLLLTMPVESHTPAHVSALHSADDLTRLCANAGMTIVSLQSKWHLTFGDDRKHIFAVIRPAGPSSALEVLYPSAVPQMSCAASSGMVNS